MNTTKNDTKTKPDTRAKPNKSHINEQELKEKVIEYIETGSKASEKYLFALILPEMIRRVIFMFSIGQTHPSFDDIAQTSLIKLHTVISSGKVDTSRDSHAIFCFFYTVVKNIVIANLSKYHKYINHYKFFDDLENKSDT